MSFNSNAPEKSGKTQKIGRNERNGKEKKDKSGSKTGMRIRNIKYYFREVLKSLIRNKIMTVTSVATVASCISIVIASLAIAANVSLFLRYLESTVGITIIIDNSVENNRVSEMYAEIGQNPNVSSIDFISAEQALENLAVSFPDGSEEIILSLADNNPLRRSFVLALNDIRAQRELILYLESIEGVVSVNHAAALTDILININNFVSLFNLLIIVILAILSVVIIMNTIKLTVNNRRTEILIMKYVGATDWFIKWPFVIEGIVIGIMGAIVPLIVSWLGYDRVVDAITSVPIVGELPYLSAIEFFPLFSPIIVLMGAFIGIFGSMTSMRKYLNV
ncbi:MAG: permease-like cell division protein FtsX [Defluviitaleaceae bacterium]|nr:permease-like cell division protein FtsX [Defluviitaleaceae bacterium]